MLVWLRQVSEISGMSNMSDMSDKTIYLVTKGDCECSHHLGFFSTYKQAQEFVYGLYRLDGTQATIQHVELDSVKPPKRSRWTVTIGFSGREQSAIRSAYLDYYQELTELGERTTICSWHDEQALVSTYAHSAMEAVAVAYEQLALALEVVDTTKQNWSLTDGQLDE